MVALDRVLGVLAWTRTRHVAGRRVIAIDGKTVRGARSATTTAPHLVAALDHASGVTLGQVAVAAKSNEIPAVRDLLAGLDPADLRGCVITVDAMHTQTDTAKAITDDAGADYVLTIKANRPVLHAALKALPWAQVRIGHQHTEHGHGRRVTRTLKVLNLPALPGWPEFTGAAQVAQLRRTVTRKGRRPSRLSTYSPPPAAVTRHPRCSPPGSRATGASRTGRTGSATSPTTKTTARSAPATPHTSWPRSATPRSPCSDSPAGPTSPPPPDTTPATPNEPSHAY